VYINVKNLTEKTQFFRTAENDMLMYNYRVGCRNGGILISYLNLFQWISCLYECWLTLLCKWEHCFRHLLSACGPKSCSAAVRRIEQLPWTRSFCASQSLVTLEKRSGQFALAAKNRCFIF